MKAERLIGLICHPEQIENDDLLELDTLVSRYPYFQAARVLYLKALYTLASVRFRNELKSNTIHISNHKQLYKYLHNLIEFDYLTPETKQKNDSLSDIVVERIKEINGYIPVNSFGVPANRSGKPIAEETTPTETDKILRVHFQTSEPKKTEVLKPTYTSTPPVITNKKVVSNPIVVDDIPGMVTDYSGNNTTQNSDDKNDYEVISHHGSKQYVIEPVHTEYPPEPEFIPVTEPVRPINTEEIPSFTAFEFISDETPSPNQPREKNKIQQVREEILYSSDYYQPAGTFEPEEELSVKELAELLRKKQKTAEKNKTALIDRFIEDVPSMPRIKPTDSDNRDLSALKPATDEELFSETLAKIYIRQQLYDKAITTYIKLSLKYPEKSVYFANRIEKIKEKMREAASPEK